MATMQKTMLIGHLGADPEVRYSGAGMAVASIRVATSESWKDKQTGERQERTEWHRIKFFGRLAEIAGEYLKKGGLVYVEGKLRTEEWEKDGIKRYSTYVVADEMRMLSGRPEGGSTQQRSNDGGQGQRTRADGTSRRSVEQEAAARQESVDSSFDDDDIPF